MIIIIKREDRNHQQCITFVQSDTRRQVFYLDFLRAPQTFPKNFWDDLMPITHKSSWRGKGNHHLSLWVPQDSYSQKMREKTEEMERGTLSSRLSLVGLRLHTILFCDVEPKPVITELKFITVDKSNYTKYRNVYELRQTVCWKSKCRNICKRHAFWLFNS